MSGVGFWVSDFWFSGGLGFRVFAFRVWGSGYGVSELREASFGENEVSPSVSCGTYKEPQALTSGFRLGFRV